MAKSGFKRFGNWSGVRNLASNLNSDILDENEKTLKQVALKAEGIAVKHLQKQDLKWRPLTPAYLSWKARNRLSTKILIATSTMFQSISTEISGTKTLMKAFIGVSKKIKDEDGNVVADIAKIHEFGSLKRGMPARPLWLPTLKEIHKIVKDKNPFLQNAVNRIRSRAN